jgi:hypothetical protein
MAQIGAYKSNIIAYVSEMVISGAAAIYPIIPRVTSPGTDSSRQRA